MSYVHPDVLVDAFKASSNKFPTAFTVEEISDPKRMQESVRRGINNYVEPLAKKYRKHVADMEEGWSKSVALILMENWSRATAYLSEATNAAAITDFNKNMFPLIRAILPQIASERMFNTQPMFGPTSNIFFFRPVYGTTQGTVTAGDPLFENHDHRYGDDQIDNLVIATGTGISTVIGTGTLAYTPILPGTFTVTDGVQFITDDGAGNLVGDIGGGVSNIVYATGVVNISWAAAPLLGSEIAATFTLNNETNVNAIPEIDLILTQELLQAHRKALRFRYSLTANFALRDQYGLDGEAELITATGTEIAYGIDIGNVFEVARVAVDRRLNAAFTFNRTPGAGVGFGEHKFHFIDFILRGSKEILRLSGRASANWILGDDTTVNIIESMGAPRFVAVDSPDTRGIRYKGRLDDKWDVFETVDIQLIGLNAGDYLIGHKPSSFLYAGFVWAPWIAAYQTPTSILDDFQARKGMASLYGKRVINNRYYLKLRTIAT